MNLHHLKPKNLRLETPEDDKEFDNIMKKDRLLAIASITAIAAVSVVYWFLFFSMAIHFTPFVYRLFGVGN
jgi:hypothetical protein